MSINYSTTMLPNPSPHFNWRTLLQALFQGIIAALAAIGTASCTGGVHLKLQHYGRRCRRASGRHTHEQCEQLLLLMMKLKKLFPKTQICGHCDMPGSIHKACPCFDAESEYRFLDN